LRANHTQTRLARHAASDAVGDTNLRRTLKTRTMARSQSVHSSVEAG